MKLITKYGKYIATQRVKTGVEFVGIGLTAHEAMTKCTESRINALKIALNNDGGVAA